MSGIDPLSLIGAVAVVPVITVTEADRAVPLVQALVDGGLTAVEITLRTPLGLEAIAQVAAEVPGAVVGAGSVTSSGLIGPAVDAGAQFLVAPGCDIDAVVAARAAGCVFIPGIGTATELTHAVNAGVEVVKVFPAAPLGGPSLVKAFGAVWPSVRFMPTGGVDEATAAGYLALDQVLAVGGSWMLPAPGDGFDPAQVTASARRAVALAEGRGRP